MHRLREAMSPAALLVAVLALVLAGAGIGYTAATVGTDDLQNNAVTSAKVKNGSLKAADLVKEKAYVQPALGNGTQGDCLWTDLSPQLPGLPEVGYRVDRDGTTHLIGFLSMEDGPGGDAMCGSADNAETIDDFTAFVLPKKARPAASVYRPITVGSDSYLLIIPGPDGLDFSGTMLPPGVVMTIGGAPVTLYLDGISFETKKSKVGPETSKGAKPGRLGRQLLKQFWPR